MWSLQVHALISILTSVSTQLFKGRMIPEKNYTWKFLLLFIAKLLLFLLGLHFSLAFPVPQNQIFLQSKKTEDLLNENLVSENYFWCFHGEKKWSVSRQVIQQIIVWGLVVWELSLGFIIKETTNQWSYRNI